VNLKFDTRASSEHATGKRSSCSKTGIRLPLSMVRLTSRRASTVDRERNVVLLSFNLVCFLATCHALNIFSAFSKCRIALASRPYIDSSVWKMMLQVNTSSYDGDGEVSIYFLRALVALSSDSALRVNPELLWRELCPEDDITVARSRCAWLRATAIHLAVSSI
jgi:hypothetical protein